MILLLIGGAAFVWRMTLPSRMIKQATALLDANPAEADRILGDVVENIDPSNSDAWLMRSRALLRAGQLVEAAGCIVMIKSPENCDQQLLLTLTEEAQQAGVKSLTLECVKALKAQDADGLRMSLIILRLPLREVSPDMRRKAIADAIQAKSPHAKDWEVILRAQSQLGDLNAEWQAYREAVKAIPGDAALPYQQQLAERLIRLGEFEEARPLVIALSSRPTATDEDQIRLAELQRFDGERLKAVETLDKILTAQSGYHALLLRGILLDELHEYSRAESDLKAAVAKNPRHAESQYRLAQVLTRLSKRDEAAPHFKEHTRLSEMQQELLTLNAKIAEQPNDLAMIRRLIELNTETGNATMAARWESILQAKSR